MLENVKIQFFLSLYVFMAYPNVIIFGETGAGKSSIVNLLEANPMAGISSGSVGCTFGSTAHYVFIRDATFRLHDTAGLDEGQGGTVVKHQAIVQLYELLCKMDEGVSLLIFCMRGPRIKESCVKNWQLFFDIICQKRVPILLAVTGLENEQNMDDWWKHNQQHFVNYDMYPSRVACITGTRGKKLKGEAHKFDEEYEESQEKMRTAIRETYLRQPWRVKRAEWFTTIVETSYKSGKGGVKEIKNNKTVFGAATNELIGRKLMTREEAEELAKTLMAI